MTRLEEAIRSIDRARAYTEMLLAKTDPGVWFTPPPGGVTHIAWQVGHLAFAQYRLALERVRGVRPGDEALVPPDFMAAFGRASDPLGVTVADFPAERIRAVFDEVHRRVHADLADFPDAELDQATEPPHPLFNTRLGAIRWCPMHEVYHCGQIALVRRQLGGSFDW